MDNVHRPAGEGGNILPAVGHELTSGNLLLQFGLILAGALHFWIRDPVEGITDVRGLRPFFSVTADGR